MRHWNRRSVKTIKRKLLKMVANERKINETHFYATIICINWLPVPQETKNRGKFKKLFQPFYFVAGIGAFL